ncbi:hypothetical protein BV22DRAFT_1124442 [Leucogyrophana mollusca]|uniref:Uncharacterized protein n=1 Tax=Leucogyrophana mollusca TaxID=85980 RepID=A0ACB8BZW1_9AGAM|nr:hypothetical protein BV22DRAFT_1124442 [Leucogyrophana mollusca]
MPKSAKKRREKAADFSKAKLKLGKGKQLASNVIDTSFKARSIALPTQSIVVEKDDATPTTKRKQSFDDLISHLKHYSAGTRKDAIFGVRELFEVHPHLVETSFTALVAACVRLIGDEDASVRKALLAFLNWLLPLVPVEDLIPHIPLLLLFTTSAQTHIFPEIRIDAVRFLDIFLELAPDVVVTGWTEGNTGHGKRVLEGYLGILSAGTKFGGAEGAAQATSTASVVLSPQSKLIVLRSLSNFIGHALSPSSKKSDELAPALISLPTWYLLPFFSTPKALQAYDQVFKTSNQYSKHMSWSPETELESFDEDFTYMPEGVIGPIASPWSLSDLMDVGLSNGSGDPSGDTSFIVHLARTLYATLVATYLDCAPVVFSPSSNPPEAELHLLATTATIIRNLYATILQNSAPVSGQDLVCDEVRTLLGYMTGYFPFRPATRDAKTEQVFQDMNVIYCELTSLLVLVTSRSRSKGQRRVTTRAHPTRTKAAPDSSPPNGLALDPKLSAQAELVSSHVIRLLRGEGDSGAQLPRPLTPAMYVALLPTMWALLNQSKEIKEQGGDSPAAVIIALLEHAIRTSSSSSVKRLTIEFVARIILLEKEVEYQGHFVISSAEERQKVQDWILHLPKVLWELGSNNLATSDTIIRALLRLLQRGSSVVQHEQITALRSRLLPFFTIFHPVRGQLPGPFTKIPQSSSHIRRLALDLSATIMSLSPNTDDSAKENGAEDLMWAVVTSVKDTPEEDYWAHLTRAMANC